MPTFRQRKVILPHRSRSMVDFLQRKSPEDFLQRKSSPGIFHGISRPGKFLSREISFQKIPRPEKSLKKTSVQENLKRKTSPQENSREKTSGKENFRKKTGKIRKKPREKTAPKTDRKIHLLKSARQWIFPGKIPGEGYFPGRDFPPGIFRIFPDFPAENPGKKPHQKLTEFLARKPHQKLTEFSGKSRFFGRILPLKSRLKPEKSRFFPVFQRIFSLTVFCG